MTASAPRWPADAALLREVFRAARRKHWSRVFGDGSSDHLPEGVTVVAERDQDGSLITLTRWPSGVLGLDICGVANIDVVSLECAVGVLVAYGVLPLHLSTVYDEGYADGQARVVFELRSAAEFGEHEFGNPDDAATDEALRLARSYWLQVLGQRAVELERPLEPLLDRRPWPKGRQRDLVVTAVTELLEADRG